ncbi:MAG: Hsp70 family protein, partial [Cyanobacteria bacterium SZAS LIN-2]|nr:Hsp70 family protein [Cyanobacteria bacterium SZAS LIN-2]
NKLLGNFLLDGIPPARRGLPKIEVSFDIDANGILSVTAKDENTGKAQKITITASTNLNKDDIERMVKEAEAHSKDDEIKKAQADLRNEADGIIYAVEKHMTDFAQLNSEASKSKAKLLITELQQKVKDNADVPVLKKAVEDLQSHYMAMQKEAQDANKEPVGATKSSGSANGSSNGSGSYPDSKAGASSSSDDVIDAEVV